MTALKYVNQIKSALPKANIYDIYSDMRAFGKGCEELYSITSRKNVMFLTFDHKDNLPQIKQASYEDTAICSLSLKKNSQENQLKFLQIW